MPPLDLVGPQPRHRFDVLSADGTRLNVEVHGADGAPTVVLAHGWTLSAAYWGAVVHRLHDRVRVVTYDQRGHGRSQLVPSSACTQQAISDDLGAVLTAAVPDGERCVVAGHSMGAMSLVALAGDAPDLVRGRVAAALLASTGVQHLVRSATVVRVPSRLARVGEALTVLGLTDPRGLRVLPRWLARTVLTYITLSPAATRAQRAFTTDVIRACPPAVSAGFARMLQHLDLSHAIASLDVPTHVLVGSVDRLTPPVHAQRLAEALPRCVGLTELPGIGHMTPNQTPDAVADAVLALVQDHLVPATP